MALCVCVCVRVCPLSRPKAKPIGAKLGTRIHLVFQANQGQRQGQSVVGVRMEAPIRTVQRTAITARYRYWLQCVPYKLTPPW